MGHVELHRGNMAAAQLAELLDVHVRIARMGNSSVTAEFQIYKQGSDLITTGELTFVVVDDATRQPVRVPEFFREAVERYQG